VGQSLAAKAAAIEGSFWDSNDRWMGYNNFDLDDINNIILLNVHEFVLNFSMLMPHFVIPNLWKPWSQREKRNEKRDAGS
jgi:hypothetical protein